MKIENKDMTEQTDCIYAE